MNYAFLGRMVPPSMAEEVARRSARNMEDAANALQWHIYDGLCQNTDGNVDILNVLVVGSFPQYYNKPFVKREAFSTHYGQNHVNIGFCNIKLIKNFFIKRNVRRELLAWCKKSPENRFVFMYTLRDPFRAAVEKARKKYPELRSCVIVADLPDMSDLSKKRSFLLKSSDRPW